MIIDEERRLRWKKRGREKLGAEGESYVLSKIILFFLSLAKVGRIIHTVRVRGTYSLV